MSRRGDAARKKTNVFANARAAKAGIAQEKLVTKQKHMDKEYAMADQANNSYTCNTHSSLGIVGLPIQTACSHSSSCVNLQSSFALLRSIAVPALKINKRSYARRKHHKHNRRTKCVRTNKYDAMARIANDAFAIQRIPRCCLWDPMFKMVSCIIKWWNCIKSCTTCFSSCSYVCVIQKRLRAKANGFICVQQQIEFTAHTLSQSQFWKEAWLVVMMALFLLQCVCIRSSTGNCLILCGGLLGRLTDCHYKNFYCYTITFSVRLAGMYLINKHATQSYLWTINLMFISLLAALCRPLYPGQCQGIEGHDCVFGRQNAANRKAKAQRGKTVWVLCDPAELTIACRAPQRRGKTIQHLKTLPVDILNVALERIPREHRAVIENCLSVSSWCTGRDEQPCIFSLNGGRVHLHGRNRQCFFCNSENLGQAFADEGGRYEIAKRLRRCNSAARQLVIIQAPAEHRSQLERALAPFNGLQFGSRKRPASAISEQQLPERWNGVLLQRQRVGAPFSEQAAKRYRSEVLADRSRCRSNMHQPQVRIARGAENNNGIDLPPVSRSAKAIDFARWCRYGSWGICESCNGLNMRDLTDGAMSADQYPIITDSFCKFCKAKRNVYPLTTQDVPAPHCNLSDDVQSSLALLEADCGPEIRAYGGGMETGYRHTSTMIRFKWHATSPRVRLSKIRDRAQRAKGLAALQLLLNSEEVNYKDFHDEHAAFIAANPDASDRTRLRRMGFIERIGIEAAVWPCNFWCFNMCYTHERATDVRRFGHDVNDGYDSDAADAADDGMRHSTKRLFAAQAFSPLLGLVSNFAILQFVYDLNLWTALCSKNMLNSGVPMRIMMRGHSFSPLYWKSVHNGLTDLVRQIGLPKICWTLSPYMWSFPMHTWIEDEMATQMQAK